jgi:hypothetical protein
MSADIVNEASKVNLRAADQALLDKINAAVATANEAETIVTTAQAELVSRSRMVGELLLEAKKRHPKVADFEAFLKRVDGLKLSRAYDLMKLAGGRITDEQLRQEARDRQRKSRTNKKVPPPAKPRAEPKRESISVTDPHVTESPEINAEERKAQMAALDLADGQKATKASAHALAEFMVACRTWLPKITAEADQHKARLLVAELTSARKAKAA